MDINEMSFIYNLIFIGILIVVCGLFSLIHLWIRDKVKVNYFIFTTFSFFGICFMTITAWYFTIGFVH